MEKKDLLFGQYKIKGFAGCGGYGRVYVVVKSNNDIDKKAYILKTVDENCEDLKYKKATLKHEINILAKLKKHQEAVKCKNIPFLYAPDINDPKEIEKMEKPYYVIDFFSKQNLYYYMKIKDDGFSEKHAKVIFKKILEAIKYCHDRNICHLDIKPCNIMFDNDFEPVILDYGFATEFRDKNNEIKIKEYNGTEQYKCPEIWKKKEYSGEKADIFSLGVVLFNLVIGSCGFVTSTKYDPYYNLIIKGEENGTYENYWNKILGAINKENKLLSENFKNLYLEMVAYNPEKRPTIDEILNKSKWLNEINILNDENKKNLDIEVKNELINIYNEKIKNISDDPNDTTVPDKDKLILAEKIMPFGYQASRALDDEEEEKIFYNNNLMPKKISQERLNLNLCIIIEGYIPGTKFMNTIYNKINSNEEITNNISFEASETDLKFRIDFMGNEKNYKDCSIDIELFEYKDNRYILEFLRKSGDISDYYKYFLILKDIIQGKAIEKNKLEKNELEL